MGLQMKRPQFLYVAELADGLVKIGRSDNPARRTKQFKGTGRVWVSKTHEGDREQWHHFILKPNNVKGHPLGREVFAVSFDEVCAFLEKEIAKGIRNRAERASRMRKQRQASSEFPGLDPDFDGGL